MQKRQRVKQNTGAPPPLISLTPIAGSKMLTRQSRDALLAVSGLQILFRTHENWTTEEDRALSETLTLVQVAQTRSRVLRGGQPLDLIEQFSGAHERLSGEGGLSFDTFQ